MRAKLPSGPTFTRTFAAGLAAALALSTFALPAWAFGTWTAAPVNPGVGQGFGLWQLTDGTVLSHGTALNHWVVLTPDATGSYVKGTWKSVAGSAFSRGGAQEHVLKDGRFFEAGGEYIYAWPDFQGVAACSTNCTQPAGGSVLFKNAEIFDPVANTWTVEAVALYDIGDTGSTVLADGRILDSTRASSATQIYDPVANTWTAGPNMPIGTGDENAWASLQNGSVLAVGYSNAGAAIYNPSTNTWIRTGAVPSGFNTGDTAGISQMFDGRVFVYGLAGKSYIYTPGATMGSAGTWDLGPAMLNGDEAEDEFTDTLPNGEVWGGLVTVMFGPGVVLQQFDPTTNTVSSVTPPPDKGNPYPIGYINLPNGQVMVTAADQNWIYTPDTLPQDDWRPTVSAVTYDSGSNTYTLTGTQLSGLINGADEGDDMTMGENYPIVWLTDSANNVTYCRSFNFSNMMPSKGSAPETTQFTTPAGLPSGSYNLFVSAVGVQSKTAFPFTTGASTTTGAGGAGGSGGAAGAGGGSSGTGGGAAGTGGVTGTGNGGSSAGGTGGGTGASSGCSCSVDRSSSGGAAGLLLLLGLALGLSRRRHPRR